MVTEISKLLIWVAGTLVYVSFRPFFPPKSKWVSGITLGEKRNWPLYLTVPWFRMLVSNKVLPNARFESVMQLYKPRCCRPHHLFWLKTVYAC